MSCLCNQSAMTCGQGRRCPLRETEAANEIPHHSQGNFRPVDRPVSLWPTILVVGLVLVGWVLGSVFYIVARK